MSAAEHRASCELHRLAAELRWPEMEERLRSHTHEALQMIGGHETALHVALSATPHICPPEFVIAYLEVAPTAASICSRDGVPPLSYACTIGCEPRTIIALASAHPDAVRYQNSMGYNVFHHCCRLWIQGRWSREDSPISSILSVVEPGLVRKALLSLNADHHAPIHIACTKDYRMPGGEFRALSNATPLHELSLLPLKFLSDSHAPLLQQSLANTRLPRTAISTEEPVLVCNKDETISVRRLWLWRPRDNFVLWKCLLKAQSLLEFDASTASTYPLLHKCMEMDSLCETWIFDCLLHLNPFYACQRRVLDGTIPLHIAARQARNAGTKDVSDRWQARIQKLCILYPKGASTSDSDRKLPLELLVQPNGRATWEQARLLLEANPAALSRLEYAESFYPYLLTRLGREGSMDIVFDVLLETPTLIQEH